ncbi:MAG: hypothetical protein GWO02_01940, partial [Gammaproteobacteria bacterium]|nr:hypothetical protein [Gammaproteobacteria bacterium]
RMVKAHLPIFADAPWRGHGLGSYEVVNAVYADPRTAEALLTAGALHNAYVQLLEEGGVLTALPIFAAVGLALATITRARFTRRRTG